MRTVGQSLGKPHILSEELFALKNRGVTVSGVVVIVVFVLVALIVIRLAHGSMDHIRVRVYIEAHGGNVVELNWAPFGPGWFGSNRDRIYQVRYIDRGGNEHVAFCRTSGWSGVYFTDDRNVKHVKRPMDEIEALEEENRRLREEVARLKRSQDQNAIKEP
jgi:hypothetical protein